MVWAETQGKVGNEKPLFFVAFGEWNFRIRVFAEPTTRQSSAQAVQKTDSRPLTIKIAIRASF